MTTVTFEVQDELVERAQARASAEDTTLEVEFRKWLSDYSGEPVQVDQEEAMRFLRELQKKVRTGGHKFTRDELNARRLP